MSCDALEKALWTIGTSPAEAMKFRTSPEAYTEQFHLAPEERASLVNLEVGDMARRGASTLLLLMCFIAVRGPEGMGDYMQRIQQ